MSKNIIEINAGNLIKVYNKIYEVYMCDDRSGSYGDFYGKLVFDDYDIDWGDDRAYCSVEDFTEDIKAIYIPQGKDYICVWEREETK